MVEQIKNIIIHTDPKRLNGSAYFVYTRHEHKYIIPTFPMFSVQPKISRHLL